MTRAAALRQRDAYRTAPPMRKAVARAAILCGDPRFQQWFFARLGLRAVTRAALLDWLNLGSRSQIGTEEDAYTRFLELEKEFRRAMR
jgi:hypothetical protein